MTRGFLAAALAVLVLGAPASSSAADSVPFNDIQSVGGLGLCDSKGHAITTGNLNDRPFVWKSVSSVIAPAPYNGPGHSATLYAYQPRKDAYPDQWNGDSMTAASEYPQGRLPATAGTGVDAPLSTFLAAFPARWDSLVQLRLYWGARSVGFDGRHYASAVLKIEGTRWRLIAGNADACTKSTAVSTEITVARINTTPTPSPHGNAGATGNPSGHPAASGPGTGSTATPTAGSDSAAASAARARHAASWSTVLGRAGAAALLVALAVAAVSLLRRRRRRP